MAQVETQINDEEEKKKKKKDTVQTEKRITGNDYA